MKWYPDGKATFDVHADERYAPEIVAKRHVDFATEKDALYGYLHGKGVRARGTVVAVKTARHRFQNVEVRSDVRVSTKDGDAFVTTVVEWVFESSPEQMPVVGSKRKVVFDPDDRSDHRSRSQNFTPRQSTTRERRERALEALHSIDQCDASLGERAHPLAKGVDARS